MKKDGSLNWFENAFVNAFDYPILFASGCAAVVLAGGLSVATIVNRSFSEENRQNPQHSEVSRCIPEKGPTYSEGPR